MEIQPGGPSSLKRVRQPWVRGPGFAYGTEGECVSGLVHQRRAATGLACFPEPDEIECE
jgi:hypothetical protein